MNARMIFGFFWTGFAGLVSLMPGPFPSGASFVIDGNIVIGTALFVWGVVALRGREREGER